MLTLVDLDEFKRRVVIIAVIIAVCSHPQAWFETNE
jgi:hypothetical protein